MACSMPIRSVPLNTYLLRVLRVSLLVMSVCQTGISSIRADVRCFCNLPSCVTSGYMCKSSMGICVSDHFGFVSERGDVWRSRHACYDLLVQNQAEVACSESQDPLESPPSDQPVRICCKEDMCNYAKSQHLAQSTVHKLNHSYMTGPSQNEEYFFRHGPPGNADLSPGQHLWFKAAVIAVPIAGGFILILLIVVAAKMLREDNKRQRRRLQTASSVACPIPHYMRDTCVVYNEVPLGGQLFLPKSISSAFVNIHHPQIEQHEQLYRNPSIATSTDTACTDTSKAKYFVFDV